MGTLRFYCGRHYAAWVFPHGVEVRFDDGSTTVGAPPDEPHFLRSARHLGYGDDTYWHIVEHDLCHLMVAEMLGMHHSGAVWAQAHGWTGGEMPASGLLEEKRLVAVQRMLNDLPPEDGDWGTEGYADLCRRRGGAETVETMAIQLRLRLRPGGEAMTSAWAGRRT